MADPQVAPQLLQGFYGLEGSSWRWTARRFEVVFPGVADVGSHKSYSLMLNLFISPDQLQKLGPLTLNADANGTALESETFRVPGSHTYIRTIPEEVVESNLVAVTFSLDKATVPVRGEGRELGLVVSHAQLTAN